MVMQCMQDCKGNACQAQHSTAQAMHRVDFCLTHELYAYICLPAVTASLQYMSTSRDGGCNSCEQPGLNVPFAFEGLTGAAESMDNSRYFTTLQHEGCHRRRLPAVLQRKGSGMCLPPCICHLMHANSKVCIYCAVKQNVHAAIRC